VIFSCQTQRSIVIRAGYHSPVTEQSQASTLPQPVLRAFRIEPNSPRQIGGGHINQTFVATLANGARSVVQRVNPIFSAEIHYDIDAVSRHLQSHGLTSPTLLRTTEGKLWLQHAHAVWRAQTLIEGDSIEALDSPAQAYASGQLLGRFHATLADLDHDFQGQRPDTHNTAQHLATLEKALAQHSSHSAFADIEPLAAAILSAAERIETLPLSPLHVVHGDPKITNVLFDRTSPATTICFVDLDTLARRPIAAELGDALRSWCNPAGEDAADSDFSLELFDAAIRGYAKGSGPLLNNDERSAIVAGSYAIGVELAARFCADALAESFFGWDGSRFPSASAHNLARAKAQLAVADAISAASSKMRAVVEDAFST
jgi:Ser/Thr protein kinase RdoA (MazF antagonist)